MRIRFGILLSAIEQLPPIEHAEKGEIFSVEVPTFNSYKIKRILFKSGFNNFGRKTWILKTKATIECGLGCQAMVSEEEARRMRL